MRTSSWSLGVGWYVCTTGWANTSSGVGTVKSSVPAAVLLSVRVGVSVAPVSSVALNEPGDAEMSGAPRVVPVATLEIGPALLNSSNALIAKKYGVLKASPATSKLSLAPAVRGSGPATSVAAPKLPSLIGDVE